MNNTLQYYKSRTSRADTPFPLYGPDHDVFDQGPDREHNVSERFSLKLGKSFKSNAYAIIMPICYYVHGVTWDDFLDFGLSLGHKIFRVTYDEQHVMQLKRLYWFTWSLLKMYGITDTGVRKATQLCSKLTLSEGAAQQLGAGGARSYAF